MKVVLGIMNFGPQVDAGSRRMMVHCLLRARHLELDTAYVFSAYPGRKS